jgi:hypothetical protein
LTATAVAAALLGVIGTAVAQDTPLGGQGPDAGRAFNERWWGIVNNDNNTYRTWPRSVRALWDQNEAAAAREKARMARAQQAVAPSADAGTAQPAANTTSTVPPSSSGTN